jgi:hypothetical protein
MVSSRSAKIAAMRKKINPLSYDLGNALFKHHQERCSGFTGTAELVTENQIKEATIPYKALLIKVGAPESLAESIGTYLGEVAEWCDSRGMPPVNALAINASLGMPGVGYFTAAGASEKWQSDVRKCIVFKGYPTRMPN